MRLTVLALCCWSSTALADTSAPTGYRCGGEQWPLLRRAVARYCDALKPLPDSERDEVHQDWCRGARALVAGCPDEWTWWKENVDGPGLLTLKLGSTCDGYWVELRRAKHGWKVTSLTSSADDPC
jgi:hypothetical protein